MSIKQRLLSGGQWAIIERFRSAISALMINATPARLLSHDAMGAYFLTLLKKYIAAIEKLNEIDFVVYETARCHFADRTEAALGDVKIDMFSRKKSAFHLFCAPMLNVDSSNRRGKLNGRYRLRMR